MQYRGSRFLVGATTVCALSLFACDESTPETTKGSGGNMGKGGSQISGTGGSQSGGTSANVGGSQSGGAGGKVGGSQSGGASVGGSQSGGAGGNTGGTQKGGSGGNVGGSTVTGGTTSSGGTQAGGAPAKGGSTGSDAGATGGAVSGGAVSGGASGSGGSTGAGGSTAPVDMKRFRYMHSSDFPPIPVTNSDPDDVQTVIRLLLYSNDLDIEGYIASAGTYGMVAKKSNYETLWAAYEKVYPNLQKHDPKYPTPAAIRAITYQGKGNGDGFSIQWGCNPQPATAIIGAGKDSEASNAIIKAADKADPRPLWIGVAGGPREVAQAIWDVRNTRSEDAVKAFISKLRVFLIACQDGTDQYIMSVPGLFVIDSKKSYVSFCCGSDSKCNSAWIDSNIRNGHGPLGALYPTRGVCSAGVAEGDTPAFMHLISAMNGVNNAEVPSEAGWGGQYKLSSDNKWLDGGAGKIVSGRATYQEEFAKRADWMVQ